MNPKTLALIALRGLGTLFSLQGNASAATALNKIAAAIESGQNVDKHMQLVADALKAGTPKDWDGLLARINADSDRLQKP